VAMCWDFRCVLGADLEKAFGADLCISCELGSWFVQILAIKVCSCNTTELERR
jgi:hypothetical protein